MSEEKPGLDVPDSHPDSPETIHRIKRAGSKQRIDPKTNPQAGPSKQSQSGSNITTNQSCDPIQIQLHTDANTRTIHNTPAGFNAPNQDAIIDIMDANLNSNRVMSDSQRIQIDSELEKFLPNAQDRSQLYLAFALALADSGTSPYVTLNSKVTISGQCIDLDDMVRIVKNYTTLRQFGRFYAKVVYQSMKQRNRPPDNWLGKGYPFECRFAAFDFFDGVSSPEAMEPLHGFNCLPTTQEIRIHNANKIISLRRRNNLAIASTLPEVTGGRSCALPLTIAPNC